MKVLLRCALAAAAWAVAVPAHAAVVESSAAGFTVHHEFTVTGKTGEQVWTALVDVGHWWNKDHTYSGDATHMSLDAKAGGCWCEKWGDSSVEHGRVINSIPKGLLRISAALGPLQELPVDGVMSWTFKKGEGGAITVMLNYVIGGNVPGRLTDLAVPVDGVIGEQVGRLKKFIETGSP